MISEYDAHVAGGLVSTRFAQRPKFKARECCHARLSGSTPQQAQHEAQRRSWVLRAAGGEKGFTLIEIMVVIIILGILAMYVAPKLMGRPEEANRSGPRWTSPPWRRPLKLYKLDSGIYPAQSRA